jgi:glycosyltransferase involved in cell wall biosynthesis
MDTSNPKNESSHTSKTDFSFSELVRIDQKPTNINSNEIIVFACIRNESLRLPYFLQYHRSIGADRFVFVDNFSTDGTVDYLLSQSDVHVYYTEESYANSNCGVDWLNALLNHHGTGHWTLTLDADELLIYPNCEEMNLGHLTNYLDQTESQGLPTFLLDMYSDIPIKKTEYRVGMPFLDVCPFFDHNTYHEREPKTELPIRGGPRHRLFWEGRCRIKPSPVLKKIPLVKWRDGLSFEASTHVIRNLRLSSLTGVLQHYKFFSDFYTYAEQEVARKEHWDAAAQYESYWNVLSSNPDLCAFHNESKRYRNSTQLIDLGLIKSTEEFEVYAANQQTK